MKKLWDGYVLSLKNMGMNFMGETKRMLLIGSSHLKKEYRLNQSKSGAKRMMESLYGGLYGGLHGKTKEEAEKYFTELQDSEDERMKKAIMHILYENYTDAAVIEGVEIAEIVAWLEKQGEKEPAEWSEKDENMLKSIIATCELAEQDRDSSPAKHLLEMQTNWLKSLKQRIHVSSAKNCKNDTLYDLLRKMPSCITVDGIDYHFVLKKAVFYRAYYEGEGEEGSGKVIFGVTAYSPIDLLTEMLEELKEEGLLE